MRWRLRELKAWRQCHAERFSVDGRTGAQALVSNTGALLAGRYTVAALGWLGTLLIVRTLSAEQWGRFSFVFSFLGVLSVFTELGVGGIAIKGLLADDDRPGFAGAYITLRGALGALSYALAVGFVVVAGYPAEVIHAMAIAGVVMVIASVSHAFETVFQANLQMRTVAAGMVVAQMAQLAVVVAIAVAGGSVVLFMIPAVVFDVVTLGWRLHGIRRIQAIRLNANWAIWKKLMREAAPLAAGVVFATAYYRIDSIMLSKLDTFTAVGIYGVAYKFADLAHYLPSALMISVLPLLVRAWPDDPKVFGETFGRAVTILALVGAFVIVEFTLFAKPVITLLYGDVYAAGAVAARVVVASETLTAFASLAFITLVAMSRHRLYPVAALAGLVTNVGLNLWLIPIWSYEGTALVTALTEGLVMVVLFIPLAGVTAIRPLPGRRLLLVAFGAGMAGLVGWLTWQVLPWPVAVATTALAYFGFVASVRVDDGRSLLKAAVGSSTA
ncbi:MAG: flippase [Actinomycetota bacterium]|nr:flippase [Actinomycetota bacterium]